MPYSLTELDEQTFILELSALEAFLFDRTVVGVPLLNAARSATTHWLGALRESGRLSAGDDVAGLTILTGGLVLRPAAGLADGVRNPAAGELHRDQAPPG